MVATANHLDAEPTGYANGEMGTVLSCGDNSLRVAFTGGESDISGKALADLLHGWAITVHRAQGSEWEAVVAVERTAVLVEAVMVVVARLGFVLVAVRIVAALAVVLHCFGLELRSILLSASLPRPLSASVPG